MSIPKTVSKRNPKRVLSDNLPYRLLAVDDNDLNLGLFRLFLTQLGHNVTSVNNPFDAIRLVREQPFDLVFTDVQMPGMTGIQASTQMRKNGFAGPIIAITAHLSNLDEHEIDAADVNDVLIKPVTKQDLNRILNLWLGGGNIDNLDKEAGESAEDFIIAELPTPTLAAEIAASDTYDLKLALERANDSKELATEMLHLFSESLEETLIDLAGFPDEPTEPFQADALRQTLHKLAGGVRFSGAALLELELDDARHKVQAGSFTEAQLGSLKANIIALIEWAKQHPMPFD
ncbi:MAG: two-component system sensor histidine kinase BarA [Candidatus Azotimanducaceae bacterium]|jgi:two-component system sensor histidine kinase BarA